MAPVGSRYKQTNINAHPLLVTYGGGSPLLHLGIEGVENVRDSRRLEHHLRSVTLGFVREFRTQLVDVDVLQSRQRSGIPSIYQRDPL